MVKVLLVVDVQRALVDKGPYRKEFFLQNLKSLIEKARENGVEVVYVRHDDGVGTDLEMGSDGWQIAEEVAPRPGEKIFEKRYNSAFLKTGLKDYLDSKGVQTIILTGMQTEYCFDATCKSAFEQGFSVVVPEETNTTFDNEFLPAERLHEFFNYKIWNNRFAKVVSVESLI